MEKSYAYVQLALPKLPTQTTAPQAIGALFTTTTPKGSVISIIAVVVKALADGINNMRTMRNADNCLVKALKKVS